MTESDNSKTFALVHGSWHDKWCWELLESELSKLGHESIAMDVPIDDPSKKFDDYGVAVAEALTGKENIVGVFHSRAGNYGPRAVNILNTQNTGKLAVKRMIFLASSFEPSTLAALGRPHEGEEVPLRNAPYSREAMLERPDLGSNMTIFDTDKAREIFYHDVEDEKLVVEALKHLRPQHRPPNEPLMQRWPNLPQNYIVCTEDRIVRPEWSEYVVRNWLGIEPIEFTSGHSPFLSQPHKLARLLMSLAEE